MKLLSLIFFFIFVWAVLTVRTDREIDKRNKELRERLNHIKQTNKVD